MHQALQGGSFHLEHIHPSAHGGGSDAANLALACPSRNLHKAARTHAVDPLDGSSVPLFHPRRDRWPQHFAWSGTRIAGLTPAGRATIAALDLNHPRRLRIREAEARFGLFPPSD
jgi:hypothetical protein